MLDIFEQDAFSTIELTSAINVVPNKYGRIQEMGLFRDRGVRTAQVAIEMKDGVLNLLPPVPRGSAATKGTRGKRKMKSFQIPHFPLEDEILADEILGIRTFGSESEMLAVADVVNEKLSDAGNKHDITLEWLKVGALRGQVMDDQGDVILDLFTEFGVTEKEIDFALGTPESDVPQVCRDICRHVELNLKGEMMTGVHSFVSPEFYDKLVTHDTVKEAFLRQNGQNIMRNDMRKRFEFHGIVFEEYIGSATDADGNERKFIPDGDARFFPVGTQQAFQTYFAPADFMETVNTRGLTRYAKQERMKFDRGIDIHTQSNPLPMCNRPALLVRGHSSD
jgi:hypothetical protein